MGFFDFFKKSVIDDTRSNNFYKHHIAISSVYVKWNLKSRVDVKKYAQNSRTYIFLLFSEGYPLTEIQTRVENRLTMNKDEAAFLIKDLKYFYDSTEDKTSLIEIPQSTLIDDTMKILLDLKTMNKTDVEIKSFIIEMGFDESTAQSLLIMAESTADYEKWASDNGI